MRRVITVAVMMVALITSITACGPSGSSTGEGNRQKLPAPQGTPHQPVGIRALQVRPNEKQPFTLADVSAYFKAHGLPGTFSSSPITAVSLDFVPSREVSARLQGETTGFPDAYELGFAVLQGDFVFSSPPPGPIYHAKRAYAAFDAKTGNLVMDGIYSTQ